jgi:hypothetical protein
MDHVFKKNETRYPVEKNIRVATAKELEGHYSKPGAPITGNYWAEGPTSIKINDPTFIVRTRQGDYMAQYNEFRNYVYYDSLATNLPGVYACRYKNQNNDSLMIPLWSEEITSFAAGSAGFAERTGTISLAISAGGYKTRQFMDDGSSSMSTTTGASTGTVQFNYAAKPIFIQTILPPKPKGKGTTAASTQRTGAQAIALCGDSIDQTYIFNSAGQLLYNKKIKDLAVFKRTLPTGTYIIWRNNKAEKYLALYQGR